MINLYESMFGTWRGKTHDLKMKHNSMPEQNKNFYFILLTGHSQVAYEKKKYICNHNMVMCIIE